MKYSLALVLALMTSAQAATIAVVDSGVDYLHQQLTNKMWSNPKVESKGDFPKAFNGWNFIDNNNQIFNRAPLKNLSSDVFRYYEVESRYNAGTLTAEDKKFIADKLSNADFVSTVQAYGGYAHGTHVAGIATKDTDHKVMGLKYIATNLKAVIAHLRSSKNNDNLTDDETFKYYLAYVARTQGENFGRVGKFLQKYTADVMNGSFGASFKQVSKISDTIYKEVYKTDPTEEESFKSAYILQYFILETYKQTLNATKNTLYVFAAGNDASNNDLYPATPANLDLENSITVAATNGTTALANFSNYGVKTVDIAAPGVNIFSAAPGTTMIPMSGTSQAAPLVARIAGKIKDLNSSLTPAQIKRILMQTVDKKAFLKAKVKSGGIVNEARALKAAELSKTVSLDKAISQANTQITQAPKSVFSIELDAPESLRHIDLPSIFVE